MPVRAERKSKASLVALASIERSRMHTQCLKLFHAHGWLEQSRTQKLGWIEKLGFKHCKVRLSNWDSETTRVGFRNSESDLEAVRLASTDCPSWLKIQHGSHFLCFRVKTCAVLEAEAQARAHVLPRRWT
ncbi:unnamed protein product [Effrenium voratum]|nr:unnamed protein product [Effrenium voratum]